MNIKSLFLAAAMAVGAAAAHSATLDQVETVVGGPTIVDSGQVNVAPFVGGAVIGSGAGAGSTLPAAALIVSADFQGFINQFSAFSIGPPAPGLYLQGNFEDAADEDGMISVLYETVGGSAAADFGSLFRLTISDAAILDGALTTPTPLFFGNAALTVEAVVSTAISPIPLPASSLLLLAATGGLMAMRRKSARAAS